MNTQSFQLPIGHTGDIEYDTNYCPNSYGIQQIQCQVGKEYELCPQQPTYQQHQYQSNLDDPKQSIHLGYSHCDVEVECHQQHQTAHTHQQ